MFGAIGWRSLGAGLGVAHGMCVMRVVGAVGVRTGVDRAWRCRALARWDGARRRIAGLVMAGTGAASAGGGKVPDCQLAKSASSWRRAESRRAKINENKGARNGARIAASAMAERSPSAKSVRWFPVVFMTTYIATFYVSFKGKFL